jgi:Pyridine nucleotide-disulphide oxidoreductase, dimerisation domain
VTSKLTNTTAQQCRTSTPRATLSAFPGLRPPVHATGVDYVVGRARYADNPRGCIIGEKEGFLKLIFRREDLKLLGVHAIGETCERVGAHRDDRDGC